MSSPEEMDVLAIREAVADLPRSDVSESKADAIGREALAQFARAEDSPTRTQDSGLAARLATFWRSAEPVLAFAVAAVYLGLAFQAVLQLY